MRRSRRTRQQPPEIVPPKSDEDDDDDSDSEEESEPGKRTDGDKKKAKKKSGDTSDKEDLRDSTSKGQVSSSKQKGESITATSTRQQRKRKAAPSEGSDNDSGPSSSSSQDESSTLTKQVGGDSDDDLSSDDDLPLSLIKKKREEKAAAAAAAKKAAAISNATSSENTTRGRGKRRRIEKSVGSAVEGDEDADQQQSSRTSKRRVAHPRNKAIKNHVRSTSAGERSSLADSTSNDHTAGKIDKEDMGSESGASAKTHASKEEGQNSTPRRSQRSRTPVHEEEGDDEIDVPENNEKEHTPRRTNTRRSGRQRIATIPSEAETAESENEVETRRAATGTHSRSNSITSQSTTKDDEEADAESSTNVKKKSSSSGHRDEQPNNETETTDLGSKVLETEASSMNTIERKENSAKRKREEVETPMVQSSDDVDKGEQVAKKAAGETPEATRPTKETDAGESDGHGSTDMVERAKMRRQDEESREEGQSQSTSPASTQDMPEEQNQPHLSVSQAERSPSPGSISRQIDNFKTKNAIQLEAVADVLQPADETRGQSTLLPSNMSAEAGGQNTEPRQSGDVVKNRSSREDDDGSKPQVVDKNMCGTMNTTGTKGILKPSVDDAADKMNSGGCRTEIISVADDAKSESLAVDGDDNAKGKPSGCHETDATGLDDTNERTNVEETKQNACLDNTTEMTELNDTVEKTNPGDVADNHVVSDTMERSKLNDPTEQIIVDDRKDTTEKIAGNDIATVSKGTCQKEVSESSKKGMCQKEVSESSQLSKVESLSLPKPCLAMDKESFVVKTTGTKTTVEVPAREQNLIGSKKESVVESSAPKKNLEVDHNSPQDPLPAEKHRKQKSNDNEAGCMNIDEEAATVEDVENGATNDCTMLDSSVEEKTVDQQVDVKIDDSVIDGSSAEVPSVLPTPVDDDSKTSCGVIGDKGADIVGKPNESQENKHGHTIAVDTGEIEKDMTSKQRVDVIKMGDTRTGIIAGPQRPAVLQQKLHDVPPKSVGMEEAQPEQVVGSVETSTKQTDPAYCENESISQKLGERLIPSVSASIQVDRDDMATRTIVPGGALEESSIDDAARTTTRQETPCNDDVTVVGAASHPTFTKKRKRKRRRQKVPEIVASDFSSVSGFMRKSKLVTKVKAARSIPITRPSQQLSKINRLKSMLFSEGCVWHRGGGFERIFAEYWDAVTLRLSEQLPRHSVEKCEESIRTFLNCSRLRSLHNKLIMSILKRVSVTKIPVAEVSAHIPKDWCERLVYTTSSTSPVDRGDRICPRLPEMIEEITDGTLAARQQAVYASCRKTFCVSSSKRNPGSDGLAQVPGALLVDPKVRETVHRQGMKVSENALWLLVVAVREQTTRLLKSSVSNHVAIDKGEAPSSYLSHPKVLAATKGSKKDKEQEASKEVSQVERQGFRPTTLSSFDVHSGATNIPSAPAGSLGGGPSRQARENSYVASFDRLPISRSVEFESIGSYLSTQIRVEAHRRKSLPPPQRPKPRPRRQREAPSAPKKKEDETPQNIVVPKSDPSPAVSSHPPQAPPTNPSRVAATNPPPETTTTPPSDPNGGQAGIKGMGRGAKDLAALMGRAKNPDDGAKTVHSDTVEQDKAKVNNGPDSVEATSEQRTDVQMASADESSETGDGAASRRGKGFGMKDLAAMKARTGSDILPAVQKATIPSSEVVDLSSQPAQIAAPTPTATAQQ